MVSTVRSVKISRQHRVRTIALTWTIDQLPRDEAFNLCSTRIHLRGDNHQSLRPTDEDPHLIDKVLKGMFLAKHEAFDPAMNGDSDGQIDDVVVIDPTSDKLSMLQSIVDQLVPLLHLQKPSKTELEAALVKAESYKPKVYKAHTVKAPRPRYYGLSIPLSLAEYILTALQAMEDSAASKPRAFLQMLKDKQRVELHPHVTLVHEKEVKPKDGTASVDSAATDEPTPRVLWDELKPLTEKDSATKVQLTIGPRLLWTERVMVLEVQSIQSVDKLGSLRQATTLLSNLHITVGTADTSITGVAGRFLMQDSKSATSSTDRDGIEIHSLDIGTTAKTGELKGMS